MEDPQLHSNSGQVFSITAFLQYNWTWFKVTPGLSVVTAQSFFYAAGKQKVCMVNRRLLCI
jgi:hypothetical protein